MPRTPQSHPIRKPAYRLWLALLLSGALLAVLAPEMTPTQRLIVRFAPESSLAQRAEWLHAHEVALRIDALDAAAIYTRQSLDALLAESIVAHAEIDAPIELLQDTADPADTLGQFVTPALPPDPLFAQQWNLQAVHAPDAWMRLPDTHAITVALIDSGICADHPEFAEAQVSGYDFVEGDATPQDAHGHGCAMAGIIGATRQNDIGIAGLLNRPHLMAWRVADGDGAGYVSSVAMALVHATDNSADLANISLGTRTDTRLLRDAVAYAAAQGLPMIAAAGEGHYPAAYADVIAVGSHDQSGAIVSPGAADAYAPGLDILTTGLGGEIVSFSGTSAASAHMTGLLALQHLTDGELQLSADGLPQLVADPLHHAPPQPGARQITVFVVVYRSSTPLYDPLKLNDLTLSDMNRSTIWHGYDNPGGQPAIEFVLYDDPVVVEGPPPAPDPDYTADYNYAAIYEDFDLCGKIARGEIDEIWLWGEANPAFGKGLEWVTNGPQMQWTWGSNVPDCGRTITTMWFEYNRQVALALHSYGHRMEGAFMKRTPCQFMTERWPWAGREWLDETGRADECSEGLSDSLGFVARAHANNNHLSACGDVHAPPNVLPGIGPYQYAQPNTISSFCESWTRDGTATPETFGCERWNCNERDYQIWWKQNIPGLGHTARDTDGTLLPNWYAYLYDLED